MCALPQFALEVKFEFDVCQTLPDSDLHSSVIYVCMYLNTVTTKHSILSQHACMHVSSFYIYTQSTNSTGPRDEGVYTGIR